MKFVHLPFSVGSLDLQFITLNSLVFMKGTSCCVIGETFNQSRAVNSLCYGKFEEVILGLHDFRCYLHVASLRLIPVIFARCYCIVLAHFYCKICFVSLQVFPSEGQSLCFWSSMYRFIPPLIVLVPQDLYSSLRALVC